MTTELYPDINLSNYTFYSSWTPRLHVGWLSPARGSHGVWQQLERRAAPAIGLYNRFLVLSSNPPQRSLPIEDVHTWCPGLNPFWDFPGSTHIVRSKAQREFVWRILKKRKVVHGVGGNVPLLPSRDSLIDVLAQEKKNKESDVRSRNAPELSSAHTGNVATRGGAREDSYGREMPDETEQSTNGQQDQSGGQAGSDGDDNETVVIKSGEDENENEEHGVRSMSSIPGLSEAEKTVLKSIYGAEQAHSNGFQHPCMPRQVFPEARENRSGLWDDSSSDSEDPANNDELSGDNHSTTDSLKVEDSEDIEEAFSSKPFYSGVDNRVYNTPPASRTTSFRKPSTDSSDLISQKGPTNNGRKRKCSMSHNEMKVQRRRRHSDTVTNFSRAFEMLAKEWDETMSVISAGRQVELQNQMDPFLKAANDLIDVLRDIKATQEKEDETVAEIRRVSKIAPPQPSMTK